GLGECAAGLCDSVRFGKDPADLCWLAGAGVRVREGPSAQLGILHHDATAESFDEHTDLHVLELSDIAVPAFRTHRPAKEEVASRLHKTVPVHHPLAVVGIDAFSSISL